MRFATLIFALSLSGCAAVFRDSRVTVQVQSEPADAEIRHDDEVIGKTPGNVELDRTETMSLRISKEGYADHRGSVKKHLNAGWTVADVATCVIPVALCIPLLVDAVSGAWLDVDPVYRARLHPAMTPPPPVAPGAAPPSPTAPWQAPPALDGGVEPGTLQL